MTTSSAIVKRPYDAASELLVAAAPAFECLLAPLGMKADRIIRIVQDAMIRTPTLVECTPASIVRASLHACELGLEPATPLGHAYLVPFYNSKRKRKEAQCIPGYKGLITLAYDDPRITGVRAEMVHEHDEFQEIGGTMPELVHRVDRRTDRGKAQLVYGAVAIRDGWPTFRVMTLAEIESIKQQALAKSKDDYARKMSPWMQHTEEMTLKTALRRVLKWVPLGTRLRRALELDAQEYGEKTSPHAQELKAKLGDTAQVVDAEILEDEE